MDLEVIESGNGGDLVQKGNDLSQIFGFQNMPYLALFGGNVEASTPVERIPSEQAFDWWGNFLLSNKPEVQFNSLTERTLNNVAVNSSGRLEIENAVKKDLEFMSTFAEVSVDVSIVSTDRVRILITVLEPENLDPKEFQFIWDFTKQELHDNNSKN
ncbi:hypothetical protein LCGC14_1643660 [marine sediment metagenome]|uniref:Uncharacterized protein n=1 Tax=marine sediment metagenome TaxID=412755 RepID=A0A0F9HZM9_9ZZZZ